MTPRMVGDRTLSDLLGRSNYSPFPWVWQATAQSVVPVSVLGFLSSWLAWSMGDIWKVVLVGAFAATLCGFCIHREPTWLTVWFGCAFWLGQVLVLDQILSSADTVSRFVVSLVAFNLMPIVVSLVAFAGYFACENIRRRLRRPR